VECKNYVRKTQFLFLLHALVINRIVSIWNENTTYHEPPAPTFAEVTAYYRKLPSRFVKGGPPFYFLNMSIHTPDTILEENLISDRCQ
jgi:hypothetical protein